MRLSEAVGDNLMMYRDDVKRVLTAIDIHRGMCDRTGGVSMCDIVPHSSKGIPLGTVGLDEYGNTTFWQAGEKR